MNDLICVIGGSHQPLQDPAGTGHEERAGRVRGGCTRQPLPV